MELITRLEALPERLKTQRPTLREIIAELGDGAVALMLLLFSLPAIVPTPGVPAGMLFGTVLTLLGLQMCLASYPISMPQSLGRLDIERKTLIRVIERAIPHLKKSQRWIYPRLENFVSPGATRGIGVVVCMLGILIALPIPFGNTLPGLAVLILALGIGQKDGGAVLAGLALAVLACVASGILLVGSWWFVEHYLSLL